MGLTKLLINRNMKLSLLLIAAASAYSFGDAIGGVKEVGDGRRDATTAEPIVATNQPADPTTTANAPTTTAVNNPTTTESASGCALTAISALLASIFVL